MGLVGEEQRPAEASGEIGFEGGDALRVGPFEALGAAGEAREIRRVARLGDHQAAVLHRAGEAFGPPGDRRRAPGHDLGLGGGAFAPRRQHAARHPRAGAVAQRAAALDDFDGQPALGKFESAGEAGYAGANDNDGGSGQSINSRSFAGMTRIRFKGFSPIGCLSPAPQRKPDTPRTLPKQSRERPCCQAARGATPGTRWVDSPKPSLSGSRTSFWKSAISVRATGPAW